MNKQHIVDEIDKIKAIIEWQQKEYEARKTKDLDAYMAMNAHISGLEHMIAIMEWCLGKEKPAVLLSLNALYEQTKSSKPTGVIIQ